MSLGNKAKGGGSTSSGGGGTDPQTAVNTGNIASNDTDITNNSANIGTNTSGIANNATDISNLATVASTGDFQDLTNVPNLDATITFANITDANNFATTAADALLIFVTEEQQMYHTSQGGLVPWFLGSGIDALGLVDSGFVADQILVTDGFGSFLYEDKPSGTKSHFASFTDTDQTGTSITWSIAGSSISILDDFTMLGNNIAVPRDGRYLVSVSGGVENNSSSSVNTVFTRIQKVDGSTNGITNEAVSSFKTLDVSGSRSGSSVSVNYILDLVAGDQVRVNSAGTASTRITNKIITIVEL